MLNSWSNQTARHERGLSLIELMVGIAVGMIVVAGATTMMTAQLADHRRLVLETQVQQDLRAAADLMVRELRRSGSWTVPQNGIAAPNASAAPMENKYAARLNVAQEDDSPVLTYSYARHNTRSGMATDPPEDNEVNESTEVFGFKLDSGVLRMRVGRRWQPMTDENTLIVTAFNVATSSQSVSLIDSCPNRCDGAGGSCPPRQIQKRVTITLTGQAAHDNAVTRQVSVSGRVRNDEITGSCT